MLRGHLRRPSPHHAVITQASRRLPLSLPPCPADSRLFPAAALLTLSRDRLQISSSHCFLPASTPPPFQENCDTMSARTLFPTHLRAQAADAPFEGGQRHHGKSQSHMVSWCLAERPVPTEETKLPRLLVRRQNEVVAASSGSSRPSFCIYEGREFCSVHNTSWILLPRYSSRTPYIHYPKPDLSSDIFL